MVPPPCYGLELFSGELEGVLRCEGVYVGGVVAEGVSDLHLFLEAQFIECIDRCGAFDDVQLLVCVEEECLV